MDGYSAIRWVFRGVLKLGFGLEVTGEEHVPSNGPVVLAVNHGSQIDPIVVAAAVPRRCTFLAAAELLTAPVLGALIRPFRLVPVKRRLFDRRAIEECAARLEHGEALVIFPEGKISTDGCLQSVHDGLAFIAARAGVPIVPIGIAGTYEVWPLGTRIPHRGRITVCMGEAIIPTGALTRRTQSALTRRVMDAISRLLDKSAASSEGADSNHLPAAG